MRSFVLILVLFLSLGARAADQDVKIVDRTNAVLQGSSEHMRLGKKMSITLQPFGQGVTYTNLTTLGFGYHLDRNSLFILELSPERRTRFLSDRSATSSAMGLHYKEFFGNSFYWKGGLDYRQTEYIENHVTDEAHIKGNSWALSIVIGNQWQWENFTLGCDWIGFSKPFGTTIAEASGNIESFSAEDLYFRDDVLQFGRFYVGYSF